MYWVPAVLFIEVSSFQGVPITVRDIYCMLFSVECNLLLNMEDSSVDISNVIGCNKLSVSTGEEYSIGDTAEELLQEGPHHMDGGLRGCEVHTLP